MGWNLGTRQLGEAPTIIAAIDDTATPQEVRAALDAGVHAIELRVDKFQKNPSADALRARTQGPSLLTIRHPSEGGEWRGTEQERLSLYRELLPYVDGVDCELSQTAVAQPLFAAAADAGKLTIGSYHDFDNCPSDETLAGCINSADELGAHLVKVAAWCESNEDFQRLAMFTLCHARRGVVVIGMGPVGLPSRVLFPALGSLLTYTFIGKPTAPGQLNSDALVKYVTALFGGGDAMAPDAQRM